MKLRLRTAAIGAFLIASPALAQPPCAEFEIAGTGTQGEYNPFDRSNASQTFDVRVRGTVAGVNAVQMLLLDTQPQGSGPGLGTAGPANYDIFLVEDPSRIVFSASNEVLTPMNGALVPLSGQGRGAARFRLRIPRQQPAASGQHVESLTVRYRCMTASSSGSAIEQIAIIPIEISVPRYVAAYIGGEGQTRGAIVFGDIGPETSSLAKSIGVTSLATVPYQVSIDSERQGRLRQNSGDRDGIAYDMSFAGTDVEDGGRIVCPATPAPTGQASNFEVRLRRNSLRDLPAGTYTDVVRLTFQPRDGISPGACRLANGG